MANARSSSDCLLPQSAASVSSATSCLLSPASVKTEIPDSGYLPVGVSSMPSPPQQTLPHHHYPPPPPPPPSHLHHPHPSHPHAHPPHPQHPHPHLQHPQPASHLLCSAMIKSEFPETPGECEPPPGGGSLPLSALMTTSSVASTTPSDSNAHNPHPLSCLPPPPPQLMPPMGLHGPTSNTTVSGPPPPPPPQPSAQTTCHANSCVSSVSISSSTGGLQQLRSLHPPLSVGTHHGVAPTTVVGSPQVQPTLLSPYYHPISTAPSPVMHPHSQPPLGTACITSMVDSPRAMASPSHQRHHSGSALPSPQRHPSGGGAALPSPSHQRHLSGGGAGLVPSSPCSSAAGVVPSAAVESSGGGGKSVAASSVTDSPEPPDSNTGGSSIKSSFIPCKVCGDKASGYHYGVISCEGCKGFFRRSIQKQIEYKCLRDGKCLVIRLNRNRCQYCRFKKCLSAGMSKDSVRYGRMPRRSRSQDGSAGSMVGVGTMPGQAGLTTSPQPPQPDQLALYDIILTVSQAHHAFCAFTEDKIKLLKKSAFTLMPSGMQLRPDRLDEHRLRMHETLSELFTPSVQQVVEFAKRMPDFAQLPQDDQLILIKLGFFEVWLVHAAKLVSINESCFTFHDGRQIHKQELDFVYSPSLVKAMFDFAVHFNHLVLNDTETGLFSAVALARPDRIGLTHSATVEAIQERILASLKLQMERNHASEPGLFSTVIAVASELASVGAQAHQAMMWYRDNWHRTALPPLYAEIFDIPHPEATPEQQQAVHQMRLQQQQQAAMAAAVAAPSPTSSGPLEKLG